MNKTTAAAAAGAVALTATGAVSALLLTLGQTGAPVASEPAAPTTTVLTEYVDQNGNPVGAPGDSAAFELPRFVVVEAPTVAPAEVIEQVEYVTTYGAAPPAPAPAYEADDDDQEEEYEEDEDEYEYGEDEEEEDDD